ncbi:hypothetical protein ABL78_5981 [Leptomonas seymouri]|uniref:Uncharacterized protein n=1 Tax=Leptomonas seymouri TaxID=5684 RepID=A0A0N0P474_LEPSE|nr:hypothetical protein ABL78_5981 [Leptomonas seymouri]|eukprot:KPI84966.1 hypothetical protein ABL78_5981 [Leptomonas seymouri]
MPATPYAIHTKSAANVGSSRSNVAREMGSATTSHNRGENSTTSELNSTAPRTDGANKAAASACQTPLHHTIIQGSSSYPSPRFESADGSSQMTPDAPSAVRSTAPSADTTSVEHLLCNTSNFSSAATEGGTQNATPPVPNLLTDLGLQDSANMEADLVKGADKASGDAARRGRSSNAGAAQRRAPLPLLAGAIATTAPLPLECTSASPSSSPNLSPPSQAEDTSCIPTHYSPRIFNRGRRTQVISVCGSSSSSRSSDASVVICFNFQGPSLNSTSPPHPSGREQNELLGEHAEDDSGAAAVACIDDALIVEEALPAVLDPSNRSGRVSPRGFPGLRTAASTLGSQPPTLADVTQAPESQVASSWDSSSVEISNRSVVSQVNGCDGRRGDAAAKTGASPNVAGTSTAPVAQRCFRGCHGAERGKQLRLGQPSEGAGSGSGASACESIETAVYHEHDFHLSGDRTTQTVPQSVQTYREAVVSRSACAQAGDRRRVPPILLRRLPRSGANAGKSETSVAEHSGSLSCMDADAISSRVALPSPHVGCSSPKQPPIVEDKCSAALQSSQRQSSDLEAAMADASKHSSERLVPAALEHSVTATSRPPNSRAHLSLLEASDYPEISECSPYRPPPPSPPPQQQHEQLPQPPPTTRAPLSLSASCFSQEALLSLDCMAPAMQEGLQDDRLPVSEGVTTSESNNCVPARTSLLSPAQTTSARPTCCSAFSTRLSASKDGAGNDSGSLRVGAFTSLLSSPLHRAAPTPPDPAAPLPRATEQLACLSGGKEATQSSQLSREGKISAPQLARKSVIPAMRSSPVEPSPTSPVDTPITPDVMGTRVSDLQRHLTQFTATPQLVPAASRDFFVHGAQRMGGGSNGTAAPAAKGPPTVRGLDGRTALPLPLTVEQRMVAHPLLGENSASDYLSDPRIDSSAPHLLTMLMLDAQRVSARSADETRASELLAATPKNEIGGTGSRSVSSANSVQTQASAKEEEEASRSPDHRVNDDGGFPIYKRPASEVMEKRTGRQKKVASVSSIPSNSVTRAVLPVQTTLPRASPITETAAAHLTLATTFVTTLDTNTAHSSASRNGNCNSPMYSSETGGGDRAATLVAVPGEVNPIPSHLYTDLVHAQTTLPASTDMSGSSASSGRAPSPRPVPLCGRQQSHAASLSLVSPPISQGTSLLPGGRYCHGSLSASLPPYPTKPAAPPLSDTPPLRDSHTSLAQHTGLQAASPISGHSAVLISGVSSPDWSASLPPPPPSPPQRLQDAHTAVLSAHRVAAVRDGAATLTAQESTSSMVAQARMERELSKQPLAGDVKVSANAASPYAASARCARAVLRPLRGSVEQRGKMPSNRAPLPPSVPVHPLADGRGSSQVPEELPSTEGNQHSAISVEQQREGEGQPPQPPLQGTDEPSRQDVRSVTPATASPSAATSVSFVALTSSNATHPLNPPRAMAPSVPSKPSTPAAAAKNTMSKQSDEHTNEKTREDTTLPHATSSLPPPPPQKRLPTTHPVEVQGPESTNAETPPTPQSPPTASPSPSHNNQGLKVRRVPSDERRLRSARAEDALPKKAKATNTAVKAFIAKGESPTRNSSAHVKAALPAARHAAVALPFFRPSHRSVTAITAQDTASWISTPQYSPAVAAARSSPLRRDGKRCASPRVQELPSSHEVPLDLEALDNADLAVPRSLSMYYFQSGAPPSAAAAAAMAFPHNITASPSPSAAREPPQRTASSGPAPPSSTTASVFSPKRTALAPAAAPLSNAAAPAVTPPPPPNAAAPAHTLTKSCFVAASPYARVPTYNCPQAPPTADIISTEDAAAKDTMHLRQWEKVVREAEGEGGVVPASRLPPQQALRLASSFSVRRTPRSPGTGWTARAACLDSTPGTDFAPSIIPASAGTADSRTSSPEASVLLRAFGVWPPVRQQDQQHPQQGQRQHPSEEAPRQANAIDTERAAAASQALQPPMPRRSRKQIRGNRTASTAPYLLRMGAPHLPARLPSTRNALAARQQPPPPRCQHSPQGSPRAVASHRYQESSPKPGRNTVATSPLSHCPSLPVSPLTSNVAPRITSASTATHTQTIDTSSFSGPSLIPAPARTESPRAYRCSVGSQTDRVPIARTALLPSPHRPSASPQASQEGRLASASRTPAALVRPLQPSRLRSSARERYRSPISSPTVPPQKPSPAEGAPLVWHPSLPVSPHREWFSNAHTADFLATPMCEVPGLFSHVNALGARDGTVIREILPQCGSSTANAISLSGSPGSSQPTSTSSISPQAHQRQAGYRSYLPRTLPSLTLTPDPIPVTMLSTPLTAVQRPHSVDMTGRAERRSGRHRKPSSGSGALSKLSTLGQRLIPLWWRKGRESSNSNNSRNSNRPSPAPMPLPTAQPLSASSPLQPQQPSPQHPTPQGDTASCRSPPLSTSQKHLQPPTGFASPRRLIRPDGALYVMEPTRSGHSGAGDCDVPTDGQQQQRQKGWQCRGSAPLLLSPGPPSPVIIATASAPRFQPRATATPASIVQNSAGAERSSCASAGQPLRSVSSLTASGGSLPGTGSRVNYYGAYQRSLHLGSTPTSRTSHSQVLSSTPLSYPQPAQCHQPPSAVDPRSSTGNGAATTLRHNTRGAQQRGGAGGGSADAASLSGSNAPQAAGTARSSPPQAGVRRYAAGASGKPRNIPFYGVRSRRRPPPQQTLRSDFLRSSLNDDPALAAGESMYRRRGGARDANGHATRVPALTRAALDTFQRAQAAANAASTRRLPSPPQQSRQQQQLVPEAYLTNPHYREQRSRAQANCRVVESGAVYVEDVTPALSAPSSGGCRPSVPFPRPNASPKENGHSEVQRTTRVPPVPKLSPRALSTAAAPRVAFPPSYKPETGPRARYSPSPVPVAPSYATDARYRQ